MNEQTNENYGKGIEYHYAPMTGVIACMRHGEPEKVEGWSGHHALMARFLELRETGKITHLKTVNYGHPIFHGHSGIVDIYGQPNK